MMGYGYDMNTGGWIAMTIFWIAVVILIVWTVSRATSSRGGGVTDTPEDILNRRYAAGELDDDAYRTMLATLRSSRTESR